MSKQETITTATLLSRLHASPLERVLAQQLNNAGIKYEREYRFAAPRRWRADFRIGGMLVECEGVTYYGKSLGRHQTAKGLTDDCEKYNAATILGFRVLRFTQMQIESGAALETIKQAADAFEHVDFEDPANVALVVEAMKAGVLKPARRR